MFGSGGVAIGEGWDHMDQVISWLLEGDVAVAYLAHRDLLGSDKATLSKLQDRIPEEGYGRRFLSCQNQNGHWGLYYYQPKWTSTHYTLLDLKNLGAPATLEPCREMVGRMFDECQLVDGGLNLSKYDHPSDVAVDGMILNYAAYFGETDTHLTKLVDYLLSVQRSDGGFTWDPQSAAGDPHTTICVLEGLSQYCEAGPQPVRVKVGESISGAVEFLLANRLFIHDADARFRKLTYPYRYRYDLLRGLEYLARQGGLSDPGTEPALAWLQRKRQDDGLWLLEHQHKGNVHFEMEERGQPSRMVTLKALLILQQAGRIELTD